MTRTLPDETENVLGVLGGLGPAATVSFMSEVIEQTPAEKDQDHLEMVVYNDPKVPDRNYPEHRDDGGPLPRLIRNARRLEQAGADLIVIASNTTHRYHGEIAAAVNVPVPNMITLVRRRMESAGIRSLGVLTTTTAIDISLFKQVFADSSVELVYPDDMERVMDSIYAVKSGDRERANALIDGAVKELVATDVEAILLGCTEFSALDREWTIEAIDPASVLAGYCIGVVQSSKLE
jgi:aspartate racemase